MLSYRCNETKGCKGVVSIAGSQEIDPKMGGGRGWPIRIRSYFNRNATYYRTCPVCGKVNRVVPSEREEIRPRHRGPEPSRDKHCLCRPFERGVK